MSAPAAPYISNKLVSNLFSQKQTRKYCDIRLKFGSIVLSAHACVVGSFSAFIDNMVTTREVMFSMWGKVPIINVPLNTDTFSCQSCASKVIDFMYLGKIQIEDHHLEHIRAISCGLHILELQKICQKHFEKCVAYSNKVETSGDIYSPSKLLIADSKQSPQKRQTVQPIFKEEPEPLRPCSPPEKRIVEKEYTKESVSPALDTRMIDSSPNEEEMEENEWAGLTCPVCHVTFMSIVKFQQHSSTHLGKIYTTCYVCSYASLRVPDLIKHLQERDHGERVCSLCLFEAKSNISLKEHLQQHDHSQPFFCLTCNTRFQTRTALNSHIVKHSSETPYRCNDCGRGFKWKHGLQSHMATHTSVKKLLCDQCGFSTAHLKSFIDHKSVHSGETFKCPIADCKFKSVRKESVKQHLSTHSKEKPYQCEICGQAFSQAKNLRRHAAIHDPSVDPEQCPFCPFHTTRSDKFRDHFRRSHKSGSKEKVSGTKKVEQPGQKKGIGIKRLKSKRPIDIDAKSSRSETELNSNSLHRVSEHDGPGDAPQPPFCEKRSSKLTSPCKVPGSQRTDISVCCPNKSVEQSQGVQVGLSGLNSELQLIDLKQNEGIQNPSVAYQQLFIYNDPGSQIAPCTLYLCGEETYVLTDGCPPFTNPAVASPNVNAGRLSHKKFQSVHHCSKDANKNRSLSLTCHENFSILDQNAETSISPGH